MVREPLYQRIERFIRDRWGSVGLVVALGTPVFVLLVVESIILRSWLPAAFAAYVGVGLGIAAFIRIVVARRRGRATRNKITRLIATPSRWGSLDRALASYNIRTGLDGPTAAVCSQNRDGTRVTRVDAELVYMGPPDPASGVRPFRSPLEVQAGDALVVMLDEPMLGSYNEAELLAVMLHLTERAALWRQATIRMSNGACEADSRTLLITHDHTSLLRALEKCTRPRLTLPPGYGLVHFSDSDLTARKRAGVREAEWDSRDRLVELREHLMAAALGVPSGTT